MVKGRRCECHKDTRVCSQREPSLPEDFGPMTQPRGHFFGAAVVALALVLGGTAQAVLAGGDVVTAKLTTETVCGSLPSDFVSFSIEVG